MDYDDLKLAGIPLLTLIENKVLNRKFWLDHGATYRTVAGEGEKRCPGCGAVYPKDSRKFLTLKKAPTRKCSECRRITADIKEDRRLKKTK